VVVVCHSHSFNLMEMFTTTEISLLRGENMEKFEKMDPMKVANNVYKFVMENDRVRVLEVDFKPGDKAIMHHHPDHVVHVLKGGKLKLTSDGKTEIMDLKTGQTVFLKAQNHEAINTGKSELDLLVIELKK